MKKIILAFSFLFLLISTNNSYAQGKKVSSPARAEYIEVEKNVLLHVTDLGEGQHAVCDQTH